MDKLRAMRLLPPFLLAFVFVLASAAHADTPSSGDGIGQLIAERGLLDRMVSASSQVEAKASELVVTAMAFLGVPYQRGGTTVETGFDCSGFVRAIYQQAAGLVLPRKAAQQAAATQRIEKSELQPGDLVFFNTLRRAFSHVGIYVGDGKFIHSPKPGAEVRVENMDVNYWTRRFDGARRVPVQTTPQGQASNP